MRGIFVAIALAVLAAAIPVSAQALSQSYHLNIPRQPLDGALKDLAEQTGLQIARFSDVKGSIALVGPVSGDMSVAQALNSLLTASGLTYRMVNDRTIAVVPLESVSGFGGSTSGPSQPTSSGPATGDDARKEGKNDSSGQFRLAQTASGQASSSAAVEKKPETSSQPVLQEVIVTAQKRAERLIDIPQSVSVLSADDLANLGALQFRDFANTVPGLTFTTAGAGYTQVSLRGVTTGPDISSTVGIYVDDVPYGSSTAFALGNTLALDVGLFDVDRIEVLRGPQGTLYGASTMGGLIKYVTKQPDPTTFGLDSQLGVADTYDGAVSYSGAAVLNAPIVTDKAAVRASAYYSRDGGYIDNVALGQSNVNRSGIYGGRLDFMFKPSEELTVKIASFLQDISRDGQSYADYTFAGTPAYGDLEQHRLLAEPFEQSFRLVSANVSYDFGPAVLTSISSYQTMHAHAEFDGSALYVPLLSLFNLSYSAAAITTGVSTDKTTEEIRLAGRADAPLEWLLGGFYTHESSQTDGGFALLDPSGQPAPNILLTTHGPSRYEEYAGFADLTWHITRQFDVSGGLRYSDDKQTQGGGSGSGLLASPSLPVSSTENVLTYLGNTRYHFSENMLGYLRYATGYRPGGPNYAGTNPLTGAPNPSTFGPDHLASYEAGFKMELAQHTFGLDFDLYDIEWSNIQVESVSNGFAIVANAPGGARIQGSELTLNARPLDRLNVTAAFAYQHAYLKAVAPAVGGGDGERLPNVPRFTGALNADYAFASTLQPTLGMTVRYVSDRTASFDQNLSFLQYRMPAYTVADLRAGITIPATSVRDLKIQAYIHNLFDNRGELSAYTGYSSFGGPAEVSILQPRTVGVLATAQF